jgi:hypothetical protein
MIMNGWEGAGVYSVALFAGILEFLGLGLGYMIHEKRT